MKLPLTATFSLYPVTPNRFCSVDGILQLLNSLDINKATGLDDIPTRVLKISASEIAPILAILCMRVANYLMIGYSLLCIRRVTEVALSTITQSI